MRCIAVDWSGADKVQGQFAGIWLAVARDHALCRLINGLTRDELCEALIEETKLDGEVVIGLDFAFSYPQWFLEEHQVKDAPSMWQLAEREGDYWLKHMPDPFWGAKTNSAKEKPEALRHHRGREFRQTDLANSSQHSQPKSTFQLFGQGAVGAGTVRGLPFLSKLQSAGAAIWPFDAPMDATVVEIYPRLLYKSPVTNNMTVKGRDSRRKHLTDHYPHVEQHWNDIMVGNDNAFDAGVSALVMAEHCEQFFQLNEGAGVQLLEGEIWRPGL